MNISLNFSPIFGNTTQPITNHCISWCKEQHFIHENNLTIEGITIVVFAIACLFFYVYVWSWLQYHLPEEQRIKAEKILSKLPDLAFLLLVGFLVWFVWFN